MRRTTLIAGMIGVALLSGGAAAAGWIGAGRAHQAIESRTPLEQLSALPQLRERLLGLAARDEFMGVVLVARGPDILLRQAYGDADRERGVRLEPTSRFRLASVSKQFTAAAILRLQDEGKVSVQDPVCRWIQPCPAGWEDIRLTHLLAHTSGLPDLMDRPGWGQRRITPATLAELTGETMQYRPRFAPGTRADYNNAGYNLLAAVVERASGKTFEVFLKEAFFDPLEMADTGSDADGQGHDIVRGYNQSGSLKVDGPTANVSIIPGAGALYSTVDDMLKWEEALHGGGLLSAESYAMMIDDHGPADQGLPVGARPRGWGYGLFTSDLGSGAVPAFEARQIYHTGSWAGFRNLVSHQPENRITVIVLTNNYHQRDQVFLIVQQAMAEAMGQPFPTGLKE